MFENFGIKIAGIFRKAEILQKELKHPYVGSEHLLLALLDEENIVSQNLKNYGVTYQVFKNELIRIVGSATKECNYTLYTPLLKRIIEIATSDALENNGGKVNERHLFLALLEEGEGIAVRIMLGLGINLDDLYDDFKISLVDTKSKNLEVFEIGNNLNKNIDNDEVVIGRDEEINLVVETLLRKKKSNPLLIGKAGVGKTAIIEELTRRINKGMVPDELIGKTIVMLEMGSLVSGTKYRGEFEERLTKIIKEVIENKNIILFIDEIHTMINAGGAEGAINASDILKPYLARGELKCIGATTIDEYYTSIFKDKALERRFYTIMIDEPDKEKTKEILKGLKCSYEHYHNIKISEDNICDIVNLADKYLKQKSNPDKTIELLDMICASKKMKVIPLKNLQDLNNELHEVIKEKEKHIYNDNYEAASKCKRKENKLVKEIAKLKTNCENKITFDDILEVIAKKTKIPLLKNKDNCFRKLKSDLKENIMGQNQAIDLILKNIWIHLNQDNKPMSLLLTGPSGVGKTQTVKVIADSLFNGDLLRLDMSEYNLDTAVNKLIGVSAGYVGYDDAYIFRKVMDNPYTIILVDEIEKAHPRVLNLFLQILDEGFVTNARGEKIDFTHTMIFMTSNVVNKRNVGFAEQYDNNFQNIFSKEFLGRFNDIILYNKLDNKLLNEYVRKCLKNKKVDIKEIINNANCEEFGLRNLKHLINKLNSELDIEKCLENMV